MFSVYSFIFFFSLLRRWNPNFVHETQFNIFSCVICFSIDFNSFVIQTIQNDSQPHSNGHIKFVNLIWNWSKIHHDRTCTNHRIRLLRLNRSSKQKTQTYRRKKTKIMETVFKCYSPISHVIFVRYGIKLTCTHSFMTLKKYFSAPFVFIQNLQQPQIQFIQVQFFKEEINIKLKKKVYNRKTEG